MQSTDRCVDECSKGLPRVEPNSSEEWDLWAPSYEETAGRLTRINDALIVRTVVPSGKRILDVGCGTGRLTRLLAQEAEEIVGVDISPRMVEQALVLSPANARFRVLSLFDLATEEQFDAVVACYVLHHLDIREAVRVLSGVLAPGGTLVIIEPIKGSLYHKIAFLGLVVLRCGLFRAWKAVRAKLTSPEWKRHDLHEKLLTFRDFASLYGALLPCAHIRRVNALFGMVVWRKDV